MFVDNRIRLSRSGITPCPVVNCRPEVRTRVIAPTISGSKSSAATALSITVSAAASAMLGKVAALLAAGTAQALPSTLHPPAYIGSAEEELSSAGFSDAIVEKVVVPTTATHLASSKALPADWLVVTSAAEWFEQHRQISAAGAMLATVFVSDKAALAHAALLERLRRNFGTGADAPVRFVYVHVGADYHQRHRTASAHSNAASARSATCLTLGRVSQIAAFHGLDVALTAFLPGGVRAFPSLLLTNEPAAISGEGPDATAATAAASWSWSAATHVGELTQLVSDWAFITDLRRRRRRERHQHQHQHRSGEMHSEVALRAPAAGPEMMVAAPPRAAPPAAGSVPAVSSPASHSRKDSGRWVNVSTHFVNI